MGSCTPRMARARARATARTTARATARARAKTYLVGLWGWGGKVRVNSLGVFFENVRFVVASPKILDYRSPA